MGVPRPDGRQPVDEVRVMVEVVDLAAARFFWTDRLGFAVAKEFPGGLMVDLDGTVLELFEAAETKPVGLSLQVSDLDAAWVPWADDPAVEWAPRPNPWGDRSFALRDPNGLQVVFFQPD